MAGAGAGAAAGAAPHPQDEQPAEAQPQPFEAHPLSQEAHPLEAHPLSQEAHPLEAHPLSQPQAGSQQEGLQHFFLQLNSFDSKPPQDFFLQQVGALSQPQDGAAQLLQPLEAHPLSQPLSQPQEGPALQLLQPLEAHPLSQPQAGSHEGLQHLRAFKRASKPQDFLQPQLGALSHPQEGAAAQPLHPLSHPQDGSLLQHPLSQHPLDAQPVSQPQLGAEQQLGAGSQHPLPPSILPSKLLA